MIPVTIFEPAAMNFGMPVWISAEMAVGSDLKIFPIAGMRFPNRNVPTVSASPTMAGPMFLPRARSPRRLSAAAFIDAKDPDSVDAASFEDVPVMSRSVWITWIASYTSDRLLISYFCPEIFSASDRSLSISVFVPPYPSFRLSSIV